jgi:hypothetical protein
VCSTSVPQVSRLHRTNSRVGSGRCDEVIVVSHLEFLKLLPREKRPASSSATNQQIPTGTMPPRHRREGRAGCRVQLTNTLTFGPRSDRLSSSAITSTIDKVRLLAMRRFSSGGRLGCLARRLSATGYGSFVHRLRSTSPVASDSMCLEQPSGSW